MIPPLTRDTDTVERSVIALALADPSWLDDIAGYLQPGDWRTPERRALYALLVERKEAGAPFDVLTLGDHLEARPDADRFGGLSEIAYLEPCLPAQLEGYCRLIAEAALRRRLRTIGGKLHQAALDSRCDPAELVGKLEGWLKGLDTGAGRWTELAEAVDATYTDLQRRAHLRDTGAHPGVSTGLPELDERTGGLQPGWLVVVAGRPGMGKTAYSLDVSLAAARAGQRVAFFSLEMPAGQLTQRLLAKWSGVPSTRIRDASLGERDWQDIDDASAALYGLPLAIDDYSRTIADIRAQALRRHARSPLDLLVIDYCQRVRAPGESRVQQVGAVSQAAKDLALDLNCPVLLLAQINRGVEGRTDKRPTMSDLKDSGDIEQDADLILFPFRPVVYDPAAAKSAAEFGIGKNRHGETGPPVSAHWIAETASFLPPAGLREVS